MTKTLLHLEIIGDKQIALWHYEEKNEFQVEMKLMEVLIDNRFQDRSKAHASYVRLCQGLRGDNGAGSA